MAPPSTWVCTRQGGVTSRRACEGDVNVARNAVRRAARRRRIEDAVEPRRTKCRRSARIEGSECCLGVLGTTQY